MNYKTKKDYTLLFEKLLQPLKNRLNNGALNIGYTSAIYRNDTIPVEGFLRILWGGSSLYCRRNSFRGTYQNIQ